VYEKCRRLQASFAGSPNIRVHDDENEEERTLVYSYMTGNLLHFIRVYGTQLDNGTLLQIMWAIGKAVQEMHHRQLMHVGKNAPSPSPTCCSLVSSD
jgi:hypothetical protein